MENTKQPIRAKAFNKIWSKIISIKTEQGSWNEAPNAFLQNEEIEGVNNWLDKELEVYEYILDLIRNDSLWSKINQ